jgi:ligand-binding sensor domain-containing protein/signal transduction histidine kinase
LRSLNTCHEDAPGKRLLLRCAIAGVAALCLAVSGSAVDPARTVSQYLHDSWGAERGLPGGSITAIAQTSDGYLWIGTDKGLVRFDGLNFRQFERAYPDPIVIGAVRRLVVDASDNLWILLQNTQVFRYHSGIFEPVRGWTEGGTTAMVRGKSGAVLLSSSAAGTLTYTENGFRSLSSAALLADAARVANSEAPDERATPFSWFDRLASPTSLVVSMVQTDDGKIWLATERRGLFYLQDGRISSVPTGRANTQINCFLSRENSELWVGTAKGLLHWNGNELTLAGVPSSLLNLDVVSLLRDQDSNVWIGTSRGLFRYNATGVSLLKTQETTGPVTALFEDREGNIWFGSAHGLERLRDSAFVMYVLPSLKSQNTGPLHVDSGGRTWIAPIEGGLQWLKGETSGTVTADGIANDVAYSIAGTHQDDVWVGRQHGGLTHLRYSGNSLTAKTYVQADGLVQNSVYAVYEGRDSTIWAGTLSGGVSKWKDGHFTSYTTSNGLPANTVSSIAEGPDGTMWFGTPNGLGALTKNVWRTYAAGDGLMSQDVYCLLQDSNRTLWIGTAEGLAFFSDGHLKVPQAIPDSLHEPIFGIAEDQSGSLWIATASHVLQVKRSSLMAGTLGDKDVREYGPADGLVGTEGVKRFVSVVADPQGRVWISTSGGLSVINPSRVNANSISAIVHIEAVLADNNPLDLRGTIRIPAARQRITFRYVGLSLSNSERVRYRYKLDNFDQTWSEPIANREVSFTNLNSGPYVFRVMASNSDGLWNTSEVTLPFTVAPVFWRTWWFSLSILFLLGLAALALIRLRVHALARQMNVRFEARLAERTRIARELHDTLLQSFQGVLFLFHAAADRLPAGDLKKGLESAMDHARIAITEGRNAVQGLRSSTKETNDLAAALTALAEKLAAGETNRNLPLLRVNVEGEPRDLHPILRDEVYRIAGEAMRNAFRHAEASRIEVEISYDPRKMRVRIRDDGKGIEPEVVAEGGRAGHWGIRGMRERASLIGGELEFWSDLQSGTEIELTIAAPKAYARATTRAR